MLSRRWTFATKARATCRLRTCGFSARAAPGGKRCKFINADRYGRDVLHCQADGLDIGSLMVQMGMARDYPKYSSGYYAEEERLARDEGRGFVQ